MDGVDISSSSEVGEEEAYGTDSDLTGKESNVAGNNLPMESDVDAELDYNEEDGNDEAFEQNQEQLKGENGLLSDGDRSDDGEGSVMQNIDAGVGLDDDADDRETGKQLKVEGELSEGEIDDLEDGELKSDEESITGSMKSYEESHCKMLRRSCEKELEGSPHRFWLDDPASVGICKFYLRGTCTWGPDCKYLHIREPRFDGSAPLQSSSSESTWPQRSDTDRTRRSRSREYIKPIINARIIHPSSSTSNENDVVSHGDETAWEKGLRQAREMMIKASKKREEEPDFDRKRLVLAPSEDMDRPRTTDDESDDSRGHRRLRHRTSRSPLPRNVIRGSNGLVVRARVDVPLSRPRRFDVLLEPDDIPGERHHEQDFDRRSGHRNHEKPKSQKIPSLIDTMLEGRRFDFPRRYDYGRDELRQPPKDLGPQVLYPNGRPSMRRRAPPPRRNSSPSDRYYVPRSSRSPHSRTSRDSRSPSPHRSMSPPPKRHGSPVSVDGRRGSSKKRSSVLVGGLLSAGDQIRDPWERAHKKERSKDKELLSLTLGAELQKARKSTNGDRRQRRRQGTTSPVSSASRGSASATSSVTSHSRSPSHTSSRGRHQPSSRLSLASAVASKNLIDDDGSLRATDLSSFRIPKKKRRSPTSSLHRPSTVANRGYKSSFERSNNQNKRSTSIARPPSPHRFASVQRSGKDVKGIASHIVKTLKRSASPSGKEDISSDESSSSSSSRSSSSSDNTEPAAYRLKKKVDDGLPTEGIPLSPEAAAEDVSSDEDENASDSPSYEPVPQHSMKVPSAGSSRPSSRKTDDDYMDNEAEKEERRAELLRQLKCVEEAIARKRSRPVS